MILYISLGRHASPQERVNCHAAQGAPYSNMASQEFYSVGALPAYAGFAGVPASESYWSLPPKGEAKDLPLSEFERSVLLFNLHITMIPEDADPSPRIDMNAALRMLVDAWHSGNAQMQVGEAIEEDDEGADDERGATGQEKSGLISIKDIDWAADGVITILLHHGDSRASDPALKDFPTGKIRTAGKTKTEGLAHAAHLQISADKHATQYGQCRALLERVPNVGRSTVTNFLNWILRQEARRRRISYLDENKRPKRCHPKLIGHSQLSHGLQADLASGRLSRVEFITRRVAGGFEEKNVIAPQSHIMTHKIIKSPAPSNLKEFVRRLMEWGNSNSYEEMQIYFTNTKTNKNHSPRFSTDLADAYDVVYSRLELIEEFADLLAQCPDNIVIEVQQKMRLIFDDGALWA